MKRASRRPKQENGQNYATPKPENEKFPPRFAFCRTPFLTRDKGNAARHDKEARDIVKGDSRRPKRENG